jgi:hypothetical protein
MGPPHFGTADPVHHRAGDNITDAGERLVTMLPDQFDQAFLTAAG